MPTQTTEVNKDRPHGKLKNQRLVNKYLAKEVMKLAANWVKSEDCCPANNKHEDDSSDSIDSNSTCKIVFYFYLAMRTSKSLPYVSSKEFFP